MPAGARSSPVAQSSSSTVWTTGTCRYPIPICIMQPMFPAVITSGAQSPLAFQLFASSARSEIFRLKQDCTSRPNHNKGGCPVGSDNVVSSSFQKIFGFVFDLSARAGASTPHDRRHARPRSAPTSGKPSCIEHLGDIHGDLALTFSGLVGKSRYRHEACAHSP